MNQKESRVKPMLALPQMPGKHPIAQEPPGAKPSVRLQPPGMAGDIPTGQEQEEDESAQTPGPHPLGSELSGEMKRVTRETASIVRVARSKILRRSLMNLAEQQIHRRWLVMVLLEVQTAILVILLPGYLFGPYPAGSVLVLLCGLVLFGLVWLSNRFSRIKEACYLLVGGGGAFVVAMMLFSAAHRLSLETLLLSLLFLPVILAAGILFTPENTLIFSILSAGFTVGVVLFDPPMPIMSDVFGAQGRYLVVVFLAMAQLCVGGVGWLLGRRMQEYVHVVTHLAEFEMTSKSLRQRLNRASKKNRSLEEGIARLHQTYAKAVAGDYTVRAHVGGDLHSLEVTLNQVLDRVEGALKLAQERGKSGVMEAAARGKKGASGVQPATTGPIKNRASQPAMQQVSVDQRLEQVQHLSEMLLDMVGRCFDVLVPVSKALLEHVRRIDSLSLGMDNVMSSAQRQSQLASGAVSLLLLAAPTGSLEAGLSKQGGPTQSHAEDLLHRIVTEARGQTMPQGVVPRVVEPEDAGTHAAPPEEAAIFAEDVDLTESAEAQMMISEGSPIVASRRAAVMGRKSTQAAMHPATAAGQSPTLDMKHWRSLAEALTLLAGESKQQERHANMLIYKLRAMLEGMPEQRQVDEIVQWLSTALSTIWSSANEVHQASQALSGQPPAKAEKSAFDSSDDNLGLTS